ncbi:hypothetical protein NL676_035411 [Syzygium grande]|nr:hypothetical protein NL676_035411 [Syzygium grande]
MAPVDGHHRLFRSKPTVRGLRKPNRTARGGSVPGSFEPFGTDGLARRGSDGPGEARRRFPSKKLADAGRGSPPLIWRRGEPRRLGEAKPPGRTEAERRASRR